MIEVALLWPTLRVFQSAGGHGNCIDGAAGSVLLKARDFVLIAIDRSKRAGAPSIKLVDHDPVRIRMNI